MRKRAPALVCVLFLLLGAFLARLPSTIAALQSQFTPPSAAAVNWNDALRESHQLILDHYVSKPDTDALLKGALQGMTDALDDPYTEFIPPAAKDTFEKDITGRFVGIGASVGVQDGWLTIAYPLEDSPAYKAGILAGDRIIRIGDVSTKGFSVEDGVKHLMGEPGTRVELGVLRGYLPDQGPEEEVRVAITRGQIAARSAKGFRWMAGRGSLGDWDYTLDAARGIVYVRLTQFTPTVASELQGVLRVLDPRGLILDLRDNPGGVLDQAIAVSDLFLESGTVVSTKGRAGDEQVYKARSGGAFAELPVAVLVNQSSASASEIVAGALQDNNRAIVVGTRTFGKGLVQRVEPLRTVPGAQLKLTEQHYYLPSGRLLQRTDDAKEWGVDPSPGFYVPLTDEQAVVLARVRREMDTIRPLTSNPKWSGNQAPKATLYGDAAAWADAKWVGEALGDTQLAAALAAMQARLDAGGDATADWTPTGADAPEEVNRIATSEMLQLGRVRERVLRQLARIERRMDAIDVGEEPKPEALRLASLWADEIDLTGGSLEVLDKAGKRVALLDVTGPDVERWLLDAQVKPRGEPGPAIVPAPPDSVDPARPVTPKEPNP
ncbi:MAG: S41 family peptidase [Phycisphaerales bacterium]